ncbi:dihydropteroate synthase [Jannaschia sp. LMIT008]|uniref:dihydropteroate synthase n=1 Tax=Jannaschia maritima TaxID=3032585 RepID=UPI0028128640|nr:dihydropteroate synthase [Jannaschia sp. LMIT008]
MAVRPARRVVIYPQPISAADGLPLAGGWARFRDVRLRDRDGRDEVVAADILPGEVLDRLTRPRGPILGLSHDRPRLMGILNVTPDSFSDGGQFAEDRAMRSGLDMMGRADIVDIGGESTRPGATPVEPGEEVARILPAIHAAAGRRISVDTRKADVARAALRAGAGAVNDVSGLTFDPAMIDVVADAGAPVFVMHGPFDPATMQDAPRYDDVVPDVFDFLAHRIAAAQEGGIPRDRIVADPGIGFGKTLEHNLALLRALPLFHALGVPLMLGVSRKGMIGTLGGAPLAGDRMPGTLALTLAAVAGGVQWHRVHDVTQIAQGLDLWRAVHGQTEAEG